jgi:FKBP-type peptidyl-prolyl cis-trans isomerase FkpA
MNKNVLIGISTSLLLIAGMACNDQTASTGTSNSAPAASTAAKTATTTAAAAAPQGAANVTELKIEDLAVGTGAEAVAGKKVTVHYTGWLTNGTKFDSSLDRGQPFPFPLGAGRVIQGWDKGVAGMKVGGKRRLTIPPQMAYGERGAPPVIPPNSTLIFEVQLLGVDG